MTSPLRADRPAEPAPAPAPAVRQSFVRVSDGFQLFYRVVGEGEPALVCCNGVGVSTFFWRYLVAEFSPRHAVVVWDYRGHGASQRVRRGDDVSMERCARDLRAVCEAAGAARPVLLGHSMGTQVILEHYRRFPQHTAGLVSVLGTFGRTLDTFGNLRHSRTLFDLVLAATLGSRSAALNRFLWKPALNLPFGFDLARRLGWVHAERADPFDLRPYIAHLDQIGAQVFFSFVQELGEHTAWDVLPRLDVPLLVFAGGKDGFSPPNVAARAAKLAPKAELELIADATHAGIVEYPGEIHERLDRWLAEQFPRGVNRGPVTSGAA